MGEPYNVFISWSGDRSKWVAEAIHGWLPLVIQAAKPWLSAVNIDKGARGLSEVTGKLQGMKVGIVCLTPENMEAPWILYEAGALSKAIDEKTRLCTYLLGGLKFQEVKPPLGMFQATNADKLDTRKLLSTINSAVSEAPVPEPNLDWLFDRMWPDLERKIATTPKADHAAAPSRSTEDMIAEVLELARAEAESRESLQMQVSHIETTLNRAPFADNMLQLLGGIGTFGNVGYTVGSLYSPNSVRATIGTLPVPNRYPVTDSATSESVDETGKKGKT